MNSTKPITSADRAFADILRTALGLALCAVAVVIAGLAFLRASDRLGMLDAAADLEEAAATTDEAARARLLTRSSDALVRATQQRPHDVSAAISLVRVRLAQSRLAGADGASLLADADARAAQIARLAPKAETAVLRAEIALARQGEYAAAAPALIASSYAARALDPRLGVVRARLGLLLWADLKPDVHDKIKTETCLVLRTSPSSGPGFEAAAIAAEAPLLPSDYAIWTADPGCQPAR